MRQSSYKDGWMAETTFHFLQTKRTCIFYPTKKQQTEEHLCDRRVEEGIRSLWRACGNEITKYIHKYADGNGRRGKNLGKSEQCRRRGRIMFHLLSTAFRFLFGFCRNFLGKHNITQTRRNKWNAWKQNTFCVAGKSDYPKSRIIPICCVCITWTHAPKSRCCVNCLCAF